MLTFCVFPAKSSTTILPFLFVLNSAIIDFGFSKSTVHFFPNPFFVFVIGLSSSLAVTVTFTEPFSCGIYVILLLFIIGAILSIFWIFISSDKTFLPVL